MLGYSLLDSPDILPLPNLPILAKKEEIIEKIKNNQVVVVHGETGCGKTTMIPLFLYEAGLGYFGKIGVTEPRRIAAYSLMPYVSGFVDSGKKIVGGHTRFWNTTGKDTQIEFMTDGIATEEALYDPELTEYSAIMIDEAHERSQNIDYLLGHLKNIRKSRPELRVIIASATIDAHKFSDFFDGAPIVEIPGRNYPVEIIYSEKPHFKKNSGKDYKKQEEGPPSAPFEVSKKIIEIHKGQRIGDILAFLAGRNEISATTELLKVQGFEDWVILPAYGHMDLSEQAAVFEDYPGKRKIILATNVAETSITPVGVVFVVDCGFIKQMDFFANSGRSSLQTRPHSKSGVNQRAGRAGRTQNGVCYRLYTEEEYEALPEFTKPEICRTSLDSVILNMRYIGIQDIEHFPFIDKPDHKLFKSAYESLQRVGALDKNEVLTDYGKKMAMLPLEPVLAHMLLLSGKYGCVEEIATIVASISAGHVMLRPPEEEEQVKADKAHERFESEVSDAITFLNVWDEYKQNAGNPDWCLENYLNEKALIEVNDIRLQIIEMLAEFGIDTSTTNNMEKVLKVVALALKDNLFKAKEDKREEEDRRKGGRKGDGRRTGGSNTYYPVNKSHGNDPTFIHPGSSTFGSRPKLMVCLEVVRTTKEYMRMCSMALPEWMGDKIGTPSKPSRSKKVSKDEARKLQTEAIAKAKEEGCVSVRFFKRKSRRGELIVIVHGNMYEVSKHSLVQPKEGGYYYALLREEKDHRGTAYFADVRFETFDFGKDEAKKIKKGKGKSNNKKTTIEE